MTRPRAARLGVAAAALFVVLAAASLRLVTEARAELTASDAKWQNGDAIAAAAHARSAARAYVPGAEHMRLGYERLREIAETSERKGDVESALFAWRAMLSAAAGSRPFSATSSDARVGAEAAVARLSAALLASGRAPSAGRRAEITETPTSEAFVPRAGWGALFLGGAALWCGAGVRLAARGFATDGRLIAAEFRIPALMAAAGFVAWVAGLLLG
jgi:hypothetical protein